MTSESTAALVRKGDPDRFAAARAAGPEQRRMLLALYAFNLEISRVPWRAREPGAAAVRFQWWRDAVDGIMSGEPPPHPVAEELAAVIRRRGLPPEPFRRLVLARHKEFTGEFSAGRDGYAEFIDSTAGEVMWLAARILGAPGSSERTVRDFAWGSGTAAYLRAVAELRAGGRQCFLESECDRIWAVREASGRIREARRHRRAVPGQALPALLAGWRADAALNRARRDIASVTAGELSESEFERRGLLLVRGFTGKW